MIDNPYVLFVLGGALLVLGAELLVRGASRLAVAVGISPLVVGLTVVAFGTSAPEMAVTVGSAYAGQAEVALGNVVGSNIFNVLFILGVSALIAPLVVASKLVRRDVPLMIGASVAVLLLALDGGIGRIDGVLLFLGIICVDFRSLEDAVVGFRDLAGVSVKSPRRALEGCDGRLSGGLGEHVDQLVSNIGHERFVGAHLCYSLAPQDDA